MGDFYRRKRHTHVLKAFWEKKKKRKIDILGINL